MEGDAAGSNPQGDSMSLGHWRSAGSSVRRDEYTTCNSGRCQLHQLAPGVQPRRRRALVERRSSADTRNRLRSAPIAARRCRFLTASHSCRMPSAPEAAPGEPRAPDRNGAIRSPRCRSAERSTELTPKSRDEARGTHLGPAQQERRSGEIRRKLAVSSKVRMALRPNP
jgi:hypothetical protein